MNSGYDRLLLCLVQMKVFSTLHFCFSTNLNIIRKNGSGCNFHFKQTKFHQETFLSCLVQQIFFSFLFFAVKCQKREMEN